MANQVQQLPVIQWEPPTPPVTYLKTTPVRTAVAAAPPRSNPFDNEALKMVWNVICLGVILGSIIHNLEQADMRRDLNNSSSIQYVK